MLAAFDPGNTTGITIFDDEFNVKEMFQLSLDDLIQWASVYDGPLDVIVYEKFITFRQKAHTQVGSTQQASQAIGAIKMLATRKKAKLVVQGPDIKSIALRWTGITMPSRHADSHKWDAYLHGYYYLRKEGYIKSNIKGLADGPKRA